MSDRGLVTVVDAGLRDRLNADLVPALRAGDKIKVSVIRSVLASIQRTEGARQAEIVSKAEAEDPGLFGHDEAQEVSAAVAAARSAKINELAAAEKRVRLGDADILVVISKEARQREDSIAAFRKGNRPDLAAIEEAELAILKGYLPRLPDQAPREDIVAEARKVIAEVGAQTPRDKGKVMPRLIATFKGRAEGRVINDVVTELLG